MGRVHASNVVEKIPEAELVRVVDANEGAARSAAERLGGLGWSTEYGDLLADPDIDAVIIATPSPLHAEMVEAAAAAGKHVFCEKPLALDPLRNRQVAEAARKAGVKLQVGFHRRFDPDYREARRRIAGGEVGDVYLWRTSHRDVEPPPVGYLKGSGGLFKTFTLHDLDAARWMVGEIEEVTAVGAALSDPDFERIGDVDTAVVTLRFASGALGVIDNSRVARYGYECSTEVLGSEATLRVGSHRRFSVESLDPSGCRRDHVANFVERFEVAFLAEVESFVRAVAEDAEPAVTGADAAAAFAVAQAADRSFREGKPVRLRTLAGSAGVVCEEVG
jgi:myo-inositol 2-dehydrogenase/D-chiro-inositol 1-dehydrogenase